MYVCMYSIRVYLCITKCITAVLILVGKKIEPLISLQHIAGCLMTLSQLSISGLQIKSKSTSIHLVA